jgi:uncharacterized membrane protein YgdD (TMEM256/DUF423 family)
MQVVMLFVLIISLCAFGFGAFCQVKARQHISKEKLDTLDTISAVSGSHMPPKEILSEKGLKYHRGFGIATAVFVVCIVIFLIFSLMMM